tara:strand:+ start:305 stop:1135 length:831 start_codon:yes stop_codon:yes gene_type:complete
MKVQALTKGKKKQKTHHQKKSQVIEVIASATMVEQFHTVLKQTQDQSRGLQDLTATLVKVSINPKTKKMDWDTRETAYRRHEEEWGVLFGRPLQMAITDTIAHLELLKKDIEDLVAMTRLSSVKDIVLGLTSRLAYPREIVESFGKCRNVRKRKSAGCQSLEAVLGDGLCVECWDARAQSGATVADVQNLAVAHGAGKLTKAEAEAVLKLAKEFRVPKAHGSQNGAEEDTKDGDHILKSLRERMLLSQGTMDIDWDVLGIWILFVVLRRESANGTT